MMLALWKTVIFLRRRRVAKRKAQWAMRVQAVCVATFMLITTSSVTWFSTPLYSPSVFSRTMMRSTSLKRVGTPARLRTGRTAA